MDQYPLMEDTNQGSQQPTDPSSSAASLERRPSVDEDSAVMTIEFLRARLLSERSVSKAARQRAQQLSEKILELEERLDEEIQLRKKLEADRLEILSKYRAELSEEFGELFASSSGEGFPRSESHAPNEEEEGFPSSRADHLHRIDSSQGLNHDEANDEDDEADQAGREKGVLSWGRRKALRKEFGHGTDWPGRSLSQRSLASAEGESPQKKWAGKSVRQIRKRESRPFSSNLEGEPGQSQISEEFDSKSSQPDDLKEQLQCEDERDTDVERVLERQAELIEQFEAEENAQRAWEAKFEEAKALASHETGTTQSISSSNLETPTKRIQVEDGTNETERIGNESETRCSGKVHPEDCTSNSDNMQGRLIQPEIFERVEDTEIGTLERDGRPINSGEESSCSVSNEGSSPAEALPSREDPEQRAQDPGTSTKYKRHLSSSFRFAVFPDVDPMTTSPPHLPGFAVYKQGTDKIEEGEVGNKEEVFLKEASQQISGFGLSEPPHDESHTYSSMAASVVLHQGMDRPHASEDQALPTKVERLEEPEGLLGVTTHEEENFATENGATDGGNEMIGDRNREEMSRRRPSGLDGEKDTGRLYSDSPPQRPSGLDDGKQDVARQYSDFPLQRPAGLDGEQDLGRNYSDFAPHTEIRGMGLGLQPGYGNYMDSPSSEQHPDMISVPVESTESDGAIYANSATVPGNRLAMPAPAFNPNMYEDTAFRRRRRSVDGGGFDRVADVLRALQIARYQIESADEQAVAFADDKPFRNGYDRREAYYAEPSHLPLVHAAPPQYTSPGPYLPRGVPPFPPNMQGWGYGGGPSRQQLANDPYVPYALRGPDPRWPPPPSSSQRDHGNNLYHYDTRHHR